MLDSFFNRTMCDEYIKANTHVLHTYTYIVSVGIIFHLQSSLSSLKQQFSEETLIRLSPCWLPPAETSLSPGLTICRFFTSLSHWAVILNASVSWNQLYQSVSSDLSHLWASSRTTAGFFLLHSVNNRHHWLQCAKISGGCHFLEQHVCHRQPHYI